jgi:hypothetical protein
MALLVPCKIHCFAASGISRQILNNGEKASKTACGRTKWWEVINFVSTPGSSFLGIFQNKIAVSFRSLKLFKELMIQDRFFHWFLKKIESNDSWSNLI